MTRHAAEREREADRSYYTYSTTAGGSSMYVMDDHMDAIALFFFFLW